MLLYLSSILLYHSVHLFQLRMTNNEKENPLEDQYV
jgi:hypothetical protein